MKQSMFEFEIGWVERAQCFEDFAICDSLTMREEVFVG